MFDRTAIALAICRSGTPENLCELTEYGNASSIADAVIAALTDAMHRNGVSNRSLNADILNSFSVGNIEQLRMIVEVVANADSEDCIGALDVDIPCNGYPRQWLREAARAALAAHPATSQKSEKPDEPLPCGTCDGTGWVCENHRDQPWDGESNAANACGCGAGAPCAVCTPARNTQSAKKAFRKAAQGHGRAGTADWPAGPYMSMNDAADVYATLATVAAANDEGVTGEALFRAFMAGDVARLTTTALPEEWPHMQPSYRKAWEDLAIRLLSQGGGKA